MKLPGLALLFVGYLLGWYGYATIQQPVNSPQIDGSVGLKDLLFPGQIGKVDQCIQNNWFKSAGALSIPPGQKANVTNPNKPIFTAPSGQPIMGTVG